MTIAPADAKYIAIASDFANALIRGAFEEACALLDSGAREIWTRVSLRQAYTQMIGYFETSAATADVVEAMTDWPEKRPDDIGWAYVAISAEWQSEAVTVIVRIEDGEHRIRQIEWGRP